MPSRSWKNRQPGSLRQAMEWCLEHARVKHQRSVDRLAELMGIQSKWTLYKWLESGRMPASLIRPFEEACGVNYMTRYIAHSAHLMIIDIPSGKAKGRDVNEVQAAFTEAVRLLLKHYDTGADPEETLAALWTTMEQLAWHQRTVSLARQPELELFDGEA